MKRGMAWVLILGVSCQQAEQEVNPELLYRTWRKIEGITNGQPSKYPLIVEFDRSGKLLYGTTKEVAWCCAPFSFKISQDDKSDRKQIAFFFSEKPDPICELINCSLSELTTGAAWNIDKLTTNELTIAVKNQMITFEAEP